MEIRLVSPQDLPNLIEISKVTFTNTFGADNSPADLKQFLEDSYNETKISNEMARPDSWFYFIEQDDQVAGYLKLNIGSAQTENMGSSGLEIQRIYILPAFKRQRMGRKLITYAFQRARALHRNKVWLGVWENNQSAISFYEKFGFNQVSEHIFSVGSDQQRDIIMMKTLQEGCNDAEISD